MCRTIHPLGVTDGDMPTFRRKATNFAFDGNVKRVKRCQEHSCARTCFLILSPFACFFSVDRYWKAAAATALRYISLYHIVSIEGIHAPRHGDGVLAGSQSWRHKWLMRKWANGYNFGKFVACAGPFRQHGALGIDRGFLAACVQVPHLLATTWSNCERAVSARFPEAVHGKKHLDNFQNKTKLLWRHLEFNNVTRWYYWNLTPVTLLVWWQWATESNNHDWAQEHSCTRCPAV